MVAILVPKTLGKRFWVACEALGINTKDMLSYLVAEHLDVIDEDSAEYVRGFEERLHLEGAEKISASVRTFKKLRSRGYRLEAAAMCVAAALIWEHLDVLENSPEAYGDVEQLRERLSPRKSTVGIYRSIYEQVAAIADEVEAPSVRGLIYQIFCSITLDDAIASLEIEDLGLFRQRYADDKVYPVFVPYHMHQAFKVLKRERQFPHLLVASLLLQHEVDALRAKVLDDGLAVGQSTLERWMLVLESALAPEPNE